MSIDTIPEAIRAELTSRQALEALITSLGGGMAGGKNCRCPFHKDGRPSATIRQGDDGIWRFKCHDTSCGVRGHVLDLKERAGQGTVKDAFAAARASERPRQERPPSSSPPADEGPSYATLEDLVASYAKHDAVYKYTHPETGRVELVVLRLPQWNKEKDALDKTFRQAHQRADGRWVQKKPDGLLPIYNRTRLRTSDWCLVVEGEKCVHALSALGIVATTSPMGAGKAAYADWSPLRGKRVYLWPDNDAINAKTGKSKGDEHMRAVAEILQGLGCQLSLVDPDAIGLSRDGSDVVDFLEGVEGGVEEKANAVDIVLEQAKPLSAAAELFDRLQACMDGTYKDVGFPWRAVNRLTQALLPGAVTVLCGAPGSTKSYLLLEALMHWQSIGVRVACFMLEHDKAYWLTRCLAILSSQAGMVNAQWVKDHPDVALQASNDHRLRLEQMARLIDTAGEQAISHAELWQWVERHSGAGCRILAIDPITATAPTERPWMADLDFVMRAKYLARDRGFSLLLVTHPRVMGKRNSPLDDMAGGSAFQRFTQTVLVLKSHHPVREVSYVGEYGRELGSINRSLIIAKATNGPGGGMEVAMNFDPQTLRFCERGVIVD